MIRPKITRSGVIGFLRLVALCAVYSLLTVSFAVAAEPNLQPKSDRRPLVLAHYMPWFDAKPVKSYWGWHWRMNAFDPDKMKDGKRSIAAHYYPLIGPYDSSDPAVIEYHLLLMKTAGIDGVVADWYGLSEHLDYPQNHRNTAALFATASKLGMKIAVCYEDQTVGRLVADKKLGVADRVKHVRKEMAWLKKNWFADPAYVQIDGKPLMLSFGFDGLTDKEWGEVFPKSESNPVYLSEHRQRSAASGVFDWPLPKQFPGSLDRFSEFAKSAGVMMPVAFPRFHDIYAEAKVHDSWGNIPDDDGRTWETTLTRALKSGAPLVQLATWNDWSEGTIIEPSTEFGYRDLEVLQRLRRILIDTKFSGKPDDLRLAHELYLLRQTQSDSSKPKADLDNVAQLISDGMLAEARSELLRLKVKAN